MDPPQQHAVSIGQDIEGLVLFPEDAYGDDYQEEDPQQEDKVLFTASYLSGEHGWHSGWITSVTWVRFSYLPAHVG